MSSSTRQTHGVSGGQGSVVSLEDHWKGPGSGTRGGSVDVDNPPILLPRDYEMETKSFVLSQARRYFYQMYTLKVAVVYF